MLEETYGIVSEKSWLDFPAQNMRSVCGNWGTMRDKEEPLLVDLGRRVPGLDVALADHADFSPGRCAIKPSKKNE